MGAVEQPILKPHTSLSKPQNNLQNPTAMIFQLEETLLRSPSLYPYFMLVALETGGIFRALLITLLYPLIRFILNKPTGIKVMTFLCFAGLKQDQFRLGRSVLPKHFLEDVGKEGFDRVTMMISRGCSNSTTSLGMMIAVSDMPSVMIEGFAQDYLGVPAVVGRELKVVSGYFVGLMEEDRREESVLRFLNDDDVLISNGGGGICVKETSRVGSHLLHHGDHRHQLVGVVGCRSRDVGDHHHMIFRHCQKVHVVAEAEKKQWSALPRDKYPKPLIFHDGRLAFRPTLPATLAVLMWVPFGCILVIIRFIIGRLFPFRLIVPFLCLTGMELVVTGATPHHSASGGTVYVCNHRTLLDPIAIAVALLDTTVTAVTYSLSKVNAVISPLRNVPLTRDRDADERIMKELLQDGDVVVCPEGTTCREPYLLRFSPLFAEVAAGGRIVPVAVNVGVSMFYGSTASGLKLLDPAFHLLNPCPLYSVKFLDDYKLKVPATTTTTTTTITTNSRIEVANSVQRVIGEELGFQCTSFTRKDKYMVLAGNSGVIS